MFCVYVPGQISRFWVWCWIGYITKQTKKNDTSTAYKSTQMNAFIESAVLQRQWFSIKKGRCCATTSNTLFSYSSTSRGKFELKVKSVLACCDHAKDMCTQTGPFQWPRVCQQKTRDPPLEQEADRRKGGHETSVIFFFFFLKREGPRHMTDWGSAPWRAQQLSATIRTRFQDQELFTVLVQHFKWWISDKRVFKIYGLQWLFVKLIVQ